MTTLQAGQKLKLSDLGLTPAAPFTVTVEHGLNGLDVSAFGLNEGRRMLGDDYIVFYNNLRTPDGAVSAQLEGERATFTIDLSRARLERVMLTATCDEALSRAPQLRVTLGSATFDAKAALGQEKAAMLLEVYRHAGEWRVGAVGQGFVGGLGELIEYFGGEVERLAEPTAPAAPPITRRAAQRPRRFARAAPHCGGGEPQQDGQPQQRGYRVAEQGRRRARTAAGLYGAGLGPCGSRRNGRARAARFLGQPDAARLGLCVRRRH